MRFLRLLIAALGVGLATVATAQRTSWPVFPHDPAGFKVGSWSRYPETASSTPGHTVHNLIVSFDNHLTQEVASVDFQITLMKEGKPVAKRGPIHVDRFSDHYFMSRHGAVPGQRAFADIPLPFDLPVGAWEPQNGVEVKILSYKVAPKGDLHDLGHFATWLKTASDAEVEQAVKRDPTLRDVSNEDGYASFAVVCFFGTRRQVEAIARHPSFGEPTFSRGYQAFHLAVRNRHIDVLDAVLRLGADPNARSEGDVTPLMIAITNYNTDGVKWLLRHGADVEAVDKSGWNAIRYAIRGDDTDIVRLLVDQGVRLTGHRGDGFGPMQDATDHEVEAILTIILGAGISVNDVDPAFGITPLMAAAKYRSYRSIRWLLRHGAKLDLKDRQGRDALAYAKEADPVQGEQLFRQAVAEAMKKTSEMP